jgi:hypothetical protein
MLHSVGYKIARETSCSAAASRKDPEERATEPTLGSEQERMASPIHRRILDTPQGASASDRIRVFSVNDDLGQ